MNDLYKNPFRRRDQIENLQNWVTVLESDTVGEQARHTLAYHPDSDAEQPVGRCCLGVALEVVYPEGHWVRSKEPVMPSVSAIPGAGFDYVIPQADGTSTTCSHSKFPQVLAPVFGFYNGEMGHLADMNDQQGSSFKDIAKEIKENILT